MRLPRDSATGVAPLILTCAFHLCVYSDCWSCHHDPTSVKQKISSGKVVGLWETPRRLHTSLPANKQNLEILLNLKHLCIGWVPSNKLLWIAIFRKCMVEIIVIYLCDLGLNVDLLWTFISLQVKFFNSTIVFPKDHCSSKNLLWYLEICTHNYKTNNVLQSRNLKEPDLVQSVLGWALEKLPLLFYFRHFTAIIIQNEFYIILIP